MLFIFSISVSALMFLLGLNLGRTAASKRKISSKPTKAIPDITIENFLNYNGDIQ